MSLSDALAKAELVANGLMQGDSGSYSRALEINRHTSSLVYLLLKHKLFVRYLATDIILFCCLILGFMPTSYQSKLLLDQSKVIVVRYARQAGKTFTVAARLMIEALLHKGWNIVVIAPSLRQSLFVRDKMDEHLNRIPKRLLSLLFKSIQRQAIYCRNGSKMFFLPNSPEKILGVTAHLVVFDEFAVFENSEYLYTQVVEPMLATTNGAIIAISTPRTKQGMFWKLHEREGVSKHHVDYRAAVKERVWSADRAARSEDEYKLHYITEAQWQMEYLANFWDDVDKYIPMQLVFTCQKDELVYKRPEPGWRVYCGMDLGKEVSFTVFIVVEEREGKLYLRHWKKWPLHTDYKEIMTYVMGYLHGLNVAKFYFDQTGSEYFAEDFKRKVRAEGIHFNRNNKLEMATTVKHTMLKGELLMPIDEKIAYELNMPSIKYSKTGQETILSTESPDTFWAFALAVYASKGKSAIGAVLR